MVTITESQVSGLSLPPTPLLQVNQSQTVVIIELGVMFRLGG